MSRAEIPIDRESTLSRGIRRLEASGAFLRGVDEARVDRALAGAAAMLADPSSPLGKQARDVLPTRTQLSPEMIDWALRTTLETITLATLSEARDARSRSLHPHRPVPARLHAVVLASNLFTASIKPIVWSLLCRTPVALKLPSEDEGLAELFALALVLVDEEVGQAVLPARFSRTDDALTRLLFREADAVSIYGSDQTVQALRAEIPVHAELIAHGHGLGAVFVGKDTAPDALDAEGVALAGLASDVAAYDQRGCLSPHVVFVEAGGPIEGRELAERLAGSLASLARERPRAALSVGQSTQQVQWRRVSESLGELFEGDGYAVAFDGEGPLRGCPLARNIAVHTVRDERELSMRLAPFGEHLKCLAVTRRSPELAPPLCPRHTVLGFMQRPTLLDLHDARVPWHGLARLR